MNQIGERGALQYHGNEILCTLTEVVGGLYKFTTPHGSEISMGFAWIPRLWTPVLNEEQTVRFTEYEKDAANKHAAKSIYSLI